MPIRRDAGTTSAASEPLSVQAVLDLLGSPRRRYAVQALGELSAGDSLSLGALADAVARREAASDDVDDSDRKAVYVALYQTHVPQLEKHGVVRADFDDDDFPIYPRPGIQALVDSLAYIEARANHADGDSRWPGGTTIMTLIDFLRGRRTLPP